MYNLQIGISLAFIIIIFSSLTYFLWLSVKVATRLMERKEAIPKSFLASFVTWISIFIVYFVWQDMSKWNFVTWVMVIVLTIGFSTVMALISALGLWHWKK